MHMHKHAHLEIRMLWKLQPQGNVTGATFKQVFSSLLGLSADAGRRAVGISDRVQPGPASITYVMPHGYRLTNGVRAHL